MSNPVRVPDVTDLRRANRFSLEPVPPPEKGLRIWQAICIVMLLVFVGIAIFG